ncbi:hypothetical protein [Ferviditalea candida]|uniref:Uncharacterized protein n=1 Tax=Ferviditalea candida TaxID=3108399 RepID=A0ABU5ZKR8_9BACL|nr:hypothetical protein [Paenibacillaceae bacterium T2]
MNLLELTNQLITISDTVRTTMEQLEQDQIFADKEYNDLTHALELISFSAVEGYKLAKQMQDNRIRRRNAKNLREQLQPLFELVNKNQVFFRELKNVHAQIETTIGIQQKRTYTPRARADLFEKQVTT